MSQLVLISILAAGSVFAQQRGMYGGISTGQMVGTVNDPGFASRLGATVSGLPQTSTRIPVNGGLYGGGGGGNWHQPRGGNRTVVVPYGIPVGYPVPVYEAPQQQQQAPTVVINQYFSNDSNRPHTKEDYGEVVRHDDHGRTQARSTPPPAPAPSPAPRRTPEQIAEAERATVTMLAFNDSSVVSAIAYWTQEDTLHFVTKHYEKKTTALDTLDRTLTDQLNKERNVEFRLESIR